MDERNPFLGVFLIPCAVNVTEARVASDTIALLLKVGNGAGKGFGEAFVGTYVLHAEGFGDGWKLLKLEEIRVGPELFYLFAIFNVNVLALVFLIVVDGETIARLRASATSGEHSGADLLTAERTEGIVVGDDFAMAGHDDGGQGLDGDFFHLFELFASVSPLQQALVAEGEGFQLLLRLVDFLVQLRERRCLRAFL